MANPGRTAEPGGPRCRQEPGLLPERTWSLPIELRRNPLRTVFGPFPTSQHFAAKIRIGMLACRRYSTCRRVKACSKAAIELQRSNPSTHQGMEAYHHVTDTWPTG